VTSLREQLEHIRSQYGRLTPRLIVDEARNPDHPLHTRFEWDDSVAGEKWRREQARALIRSVAVTYVNPGGQRSRVRAFHAVRTERQYEFQPVDVIVHDTVLSELLRRDMEREWRVLKSRWGRFEEFLSMVRRDLEE
jgi:hypothetical protein